MLFWLLLALVALAAGLRVWSGYPRPQPAIRLLSPREAALVVAAADALYPPGGAIEPSGSEAGVLAYTDRYLAAMPPGPRRLMRLLFFLVEQATLLLPAPPPRGRRRFSSLSAEQRVAALDGWRTSRHFARRLVFTSLRAVLTMGYCAHPPVLRRLGLAPYAIETPVCEADLLYPPVGAHPETIAYTAADVSAAAARPPLELEGPLDPRYADPAS